MGNGGSSVRSASRINDVNLLRALPSRKPETTADKLRNAMLTAGNAKRPVDAPQSDGVYCPSCGKSHRAGTVCPVAKSFFFHQAFRELCKGNDWHDRKTGQFTTRGSGTRSAVSSHTGKHGPGEGRKGASKDTAQVKKRGKERAESAEKQKKRVTDPSEQAGRATAQIGKKPKPQAEDTQGIDVGRADTFEAQARPQEVTAPAGKIPDHSVVAGAERGAVVSWPSSKADELLDNVTDITGSSLRDSPQIEAQRIKTAADFQRQAKPGDLQPAEVALFKDGRMEIVSGRHRLHAMKESGADVPVRFVEAYEEPTVAEGSRTGAATPAAKQRQADIGTVRDGGGRPAQRPVEAGEQPPAGVEEEEERHPGQTAWEKLRDPIYEKDPESFRSQSKPGTPIPQDDYETARQTTARSHQEHAYDLAKQRGASEFEANQVAHQAWQDHHTAHEYARANNIPVDMVAGNEGNLAARARAESPSPFAQTAQAPSATAQAIQTLRGGEAQPSQLPSPTAQASQTLREQFPAGQATMREQFPAGQATMREEAPAGARTIQETLPAGAAAGAIAQDEAKQPGAPAAPTPDAPGPIPEAQPRQPTRAIPRRGVSFSQMYGAGSAIGSGLATPGGSIAPTAGLGAQQVHHLLNPQLRREAAPAMATQGAPRAGAISPQAQRANPRVRGSQQSLRQ